jgi:DNA-binding winged helix-turn-helix (wHTH) protein/TolB-like protein
VIFEFGPFRYDAGQRLLFRGAELVPLGPKVADTLHVLLERRGQVVDKAELMKLVWPDAAVEEVGLARNISLLRKVLDDDSGQNLYIETIPRRGYRFTAQVATPPVAAAPEPRRRQRHLWRWSILLGCAIAAALFTYYQFFVPSPYLAKSHGASLAVVPFPCLCPGMDGDKFSTGLNDLVVTGLSKLNGVQVIAPSTVRRHQHAGISMGLMARLLRLDVLVEGSIQRLDNRLRIAARVVDVPTSRVIWAESYDEPADDLAAAQAAVARAVTAEAGKRLSSGTR